MRPPAGRYPRTCFTVIPGALFLLSCSGASPRDWPPFPAGRPAASSPTPGTLPGESRLWLDAVAEGPLMPAPAGDGVPGNAPGPQDLLPSQRFRDYFFSVKSSETELMQ